MLIPVTVPVADPIMAIDGLPLIQVPVAVGSVSIVTAPAQMVDTPVMAEGGALTVTVLVAMQPVGKL